jgi:hypothetical protein
MVACRRPQAAGVADVVPVLLADRQDLGNPVVPGIQGLAVDRRRPHAAADRPVALEDVVRCPWQRGEVDHAAAADAVPAEDAHPVPGDEVEHPCVGLAEEVVVIEVLALQPGATFQHRDLRAARREVVGRDGPTEPAADDQDVGLFRTHDCPSQAPGSRSRSPCVNDSLASSLMPPPRPLRRAGTLRRLRYSGPLRGLEAGLNIDDSLRKLRSCRAP